MLGLGLFRLELDTAGKALEPEGHPRVLQDRADRARFGDARELLLIASTGDDEGLLRPGDSLSRLKRLHERLRTLPVVQASGVESLASLPAPTTGDATTLVVGNALDRVPEPSRFDEWRNALLALPGVDGSLISHNRRHALFVLRVPEEVRSQDAARAIERALPELESESGFRLTLGGPLAAESTLGGAVLSDLSWLIPVMLLVIAASLAASLRSLAGVAIPLLECGLVLIATFGAMGWSGSPVALVTTILPVVLLAIAIADEIHLLERVQSGRGVSASGPSSPERRGAVLRSIERVGPPIALTSLTTAVAFLSFTSASVAPLRSFGVFAALGIAIAMLLTFTAIPALLTLVPGSWLAARKSAPSRRNALEVVAAAIEAKPGRAFAGGAFAMLLLLPSLPRLVVSDSWVGNFAPDASVVRAHALLENEFSGAYRLDVVFEGPPETFHTRAGLELLQRASEHATGFSGIASSLSPLDFLDALRESLGLDTESPLTRGQVVALRSLTDAIPNGAGIERTLSSDAAAARLRLQVRDASWAHATALEAEWNTWLSRQRLPEGVTAHLGGELAMASVMVEAIVANQLRSIAWALCAVAFVLVLFGEGLPALAALIPAVASTASVFAIMAALGLELGVATSLFASLAIGVGVDFGIHLDHRMRRHRDSLAAALRPLLWNALVLALGFVVLASSSLRPNHALGLLLALATLACFVASALWMPWLLAARGRRAKAATALLAVVGGLALPTSPAWPDSASSPCDRAAGDPAATRRIAEIEAGMRAYRRFERIEIATLHHAESRGRSPLANPPPKVLWGAMEARAELSWLLYVFSGPSGLAGTSLLLRDAERGHEEDATWFYLRAFDAFRRVEGRVEQVRVPGTALTYEDARGWLAGSRYVFARSGDAPERLLACPISTEIANQLGVGWLEVELDPSKPLIRGVRYRDASGRVLKHYEVIEVDSSGPIPLPSVARIEDPLERFTNELHTTRWPLPDALPEDLFSPEGVREKSFRARLREAVGASAPDALLQLDRELAAADAEMARWQEEHRATP